jgi:hypothetical protein
MAADPILPLLEAGGHEAILLSTEPAAGVVDALLAERGEAPR